MDRTCFKSREICKRKIRSIGRACILYMWWLKRWLFTHPYTQLVRSLVRWCMAQINNARQAMYKVRQLLHLKFVILVLLVIVLYAGAKSCMISMYYMHSLIYPTVWSTSSACISPLSSSLQKRLKSCWTWDDEREAETRWEQGTDMNKDEGRVR